MENTVIDEDTYDFGIILKRLRKERSMSQAQLAELIHKESSIISRYENNLLAPTFETICEFAQIFNVSVDFLAGVDKKKGVDLDDLTEVQLSIIDDLVMLFRKKNNNKRSDYEIRYKLIERLFLEFL